MGGDPKTFLAIMQEVYRIAAPGARVLINVPHPRHDHFISDPTHVRAITPETLRMFDRRLNETWQRDGAANTPLALYAGVDFHLVGYETVLENDYWAQLKAGEISPAQVEHLVRTSFNIVKELRFGPRGAQVDCVVGPLHRPRGGNSLTARLFPTWRARRLRRVSQTAIDRPAVAARPWERLRPVHPRPRDPAPSSA